ncbi:MAG: class I SAM-dependent methyltransferase [Planctomycetota bacterium]
MLKILKGIIRRLGIDDLVFRRLFLFWQKLGFHLIRNHYYNPIPDTRELKDDIWLRHSELVGININEAKQLKLLENFASKFKDEYDKFPSSKEETMNAYDYYSQNESFDSIDSEILYCIIRYFRPLKIFEIGSGFSTYLSAQAILKNEKDGFPGCELVAFEPYPNETLKKGFPGLANLVSKKVQDIPLSEFRKLKENDILFIDSSHTLKIGGDVQYEYLEILPRLNKGVIVHSHDIFLPAEYPKEWILKYHRFWSEQYLLQAFLAFNDSFEVLWAGNYMHLKHPDKLGKDFNAYQQNRVASGSFWMRKVK